MHEGRRAYLIERFIDISILEAIIATASSALNKKQERSVTVSMLMIWVTEAKLTG